MFQELLIIDGTTLEMWTVDADLSIGDVCAAATSTEMLFFVLNSVSQIYRRTRNESIQRLLAELLYVKIFYKFLLTL